MTAPAATARQNPGAGRLGDGYQSFVTIALDPDIALWEKSITPPGLEADEGIDTTTQHNLVVRQKSPRGLVTMTDCTFTAEYKPAVYTQVLAVINRPTTITNQWPNHDTLAWYGYLKSFIPGELVEGTVPEATVTVVPTNTDPTTCQEELPVYVAGSGTGAC